MPAVETNYQPTWSRKFPLLTVAESTRLGGVSPLPTAALNLVNQTWDTPDNVIHNRERFCTDLDWKIDRLATLTQVHGQRVIAVEGPGTSPGYDALVTNRDDVLLAVTIADCTPVLLYDPVAGALGAAHAGWRGTVGEIGAATLRYMQELYGSRPGDCYAFIGTCIDEDDFEVDADVADHFGTEYKHWDKSRQKFLIDLKKANRDQLLNQGVPIEQIESSPYSTVRNNDRYFSHRAEKGYTGRMLAVIGRKKSAKK